MTEATLHDPRPRRAATHPWAAWASRLVLSFLFAVGMLGAGARPLVESELDPTVEVGEDAEGVAREGKVARVVRRHASQRGGWSARRLERSRAPQRLDPTVRAPSPPRWQRPRRAPPPADDDDDIAIG